MESSKNTQIKSQLNIHPSAGRNQKIKHLLTDKKTLHDKRSNMIALENKLAKHEKTKTNWKNAVKFNVAKKNCTL